MTDVVWCVVEVGRRRRRRQLSSPAAVILSSASVQWYNTISAAQAVRERHGWLLSVIAAHRNHENTFIMKKLNENDKQTDLM